MLKHLTIKNYALIRHLELNPSRHLNVVTGETGAGKSIMLGALNLLMGNRADTRVLWNENEKCIIEGTYDIKDYRLKSLFKSLDLDYEDVTVIRREISPGGKSRAFVNDTPVALDAMKSLGSKLMDIHSQHETLQLGNQLYQLHLIDAFAGNSSIREEYSAAWEDFVKAKDAHETLVAQAESLRQEADFVNFQLDEFRKAGLEEGEQEKLEAELKMMDHSEEIKRRFVELKELLSGSEYNVQSQLTLAKGHLQNISDYSTSYEALFRRIESARLELKDIADEIDNEEQKIEFDPERAELVKERLSNIYRLQKKHRSSTVRELLTIQKALEEKAMITSDIDGALAKSKEAFSETSLRLQTVAKQLSDSRKKAFAPLSGQIGKLLKDLGIPDAVLEIERQEIAAGPSGSDKVEILFSANKGIAPKPLASVASGGEFSRLMFAIKYVMAEKSAMPTLILDEIDNGVSGEIALKLGSMMVDMSKRHQLITISHLPQIAAKGNAHYFVYKDSSEKKTISNIRELSNSERVEEIAKMIGGAKPSKIALQNAEELLAR
jgi:DNA repair protein RecN (Recombination protein N)